MLGITTPFRASSYVSLIKGFLALISSARAFSAGTPSGASASISLRPSAVHTFFSRNCAARSAFGLERLMSAVKTPTKFVGDFLLGFHFDGNAHLLFKFLTEFTQSVIPSIIAYPNEEFAVCPGKSSNGGKEYEQSKEKFLLIFLEMLGDKDFSDSPSARSADRRSSGFASLSLVSLSRFAARRGRDPGRDALLSVAGVVHGGAPIRLQLGGRRRLAVHERPRRGAPLEGRRPASNIDRGSLGTLVL
jgi:hypothetical protein